jgi:hypothetical protein
MDVQDDEEVKNPNSRLLIGSRDKNVLWYNPELVTLTEAQRDLFENYSHIATEEVIPHILKVVRVRSINFMSHINPSNSGIKHGTFYHFRVWGCSGLSTSRCPIRLLTLLY